MNPKDNPLMYFFYITKAIERTIAKRIQEECGITHSDGKLLVMIGMCPSVHQVDLAELLDISAPAVSRKIERLVKKGYVTRKINKNNRRSQDIGLTKEGTKIFKKTHTCLTDTLHQLYKDIDGFKKDTEKDLERVAGLMKGDMSNAELCVQKAFDKNYK